MPDEPKDDDSAIVPPVRPAALTSCDPDAVWVDISLAPYEDKGDWTEGDWTVPGEVVLCAVSAEGDVCCKPEISMEGDAAVAATRTVAVTTSAEGKFLFLDDAGDARIVGTYDVPDGEPAPGVPVSGGPFVEAVDSKLRRQDGQWVGVNFDIPSEAAGAVSIARGQWLANVLWLDGVGRLWLLDWVWTGDPTDPTLQEVPPRAPATKWVSLSNEQDYHARAVHAVDDIGGVASIDFLLLEYWGVADERYDVPVTCGGIRERDRAVHIVDDRRRVFAFEDPAFENADVRWTTFRTMRGVWCALSEDGRVACSDPALSPSGTLFERGPLTTAPSCDVHSYWLWDVWGEEADVEVSP